VAGFRSCKIGRGALIARRACQPGEVPVQGSSLRRCSSGVEQRFRKPQVAGSNPAIGSKTRGIQAVSRTGGAWVPRGIWRPGSDRQLAGDATGDARSWRSRPWKRRTRLRGSSRLLPETTHRVMSSGYGASALMVPDSVSLFCPHCGQHTAVSPAPLSIIAPNEHMPNGIADTPIAKWIAKIPYYRYGSGCWWLGKCNACKRPVLVNGLGTTVYPCPQPGPVNEAIPEPMRSDLSEAKRCQAVGAWSAAVVMARRALQCSAVERGAPTAKLWEQIKWLEENRKITPEQRQWADAARWVGNHGAHDTEPNVAAGSAVITDVTEDDAKDTIQLVEHLFEALYVATKIAREQLAKRGKLPKT
jgi:hypothetical protein